MCCLCNITNILWNYVNLPVSHFSDVIMSVMASQITGVSPVCSGICSGIDQRKHQSSASLTFMSKSTDDWSQRPVTLKMFPFDDIIKTFEFRVKKQASVTQIYIYQRLSGILVFPLLIQWWYCSIGLGHLHIIKKSLKNIKYYDNFQQFEVLFKYSLMYLICP